MKTKLIPLLVVVAAALSTRAQQPSATPALAGTAPAAANSNHNHSTARVSGNSGIAVEETEVTASASTDGAPAAMPAQTFQERLNGIVRRRDSAASPMRSVSIILTSPMPQKDVDELSEDLAVLNFIFSRNVERTFGDKGTDYRLGVPITLRDSQFVETSYLQDFGALVKVRVPFPVVSTGEGEKKTEAASSQNSDWEKARRAVYGNVDPANSGGANNASVSYDDRLVSELKRQMFDALKNASNVRHLEGNQNITVVVLGGPNSAGRGQFNGGGAGEASWARSTVLSIRISKAQADDASKSGSGSDDLAKQATVLAYFDNAISARFNNTRLDGSTTFGVGNFGAGYGFYPNPSTR